MIINMTEQHTRKDFLHQWGLALDYGWQLMPNKNILGNFDAVAPKHFDCRKNNWAAIFERFDLGGIVVIVPNYMWQDRGLKNEN